MKKKKAFVVTIETILLFLLCTMVVLTCLQMFSGNLSDLFGQDRHYKKLFLREEYFNK